MLIADTEDRLRAMGHVSNSLNTARLESGVYRDFEEDTSPSHAEPWYERDTIGVLRDDAVFDKVVTSDVCA